MAINCKPSNRLTQTNLLLAVHPEVAGKSSHTCRFSTDSMANVSQTHVHNPILVIHPEVAGGHGGLQALPALPHAVVEAAAAGREGCECFEAEQAALS